MTIINADTYKWTLEQADNSFDHIITDYDYGKDFPLSEFMRICRGNIITFCNPKSRPFECFDELAFWIKTPSTKNYSKHIGNFVEEILIIRRDSTFNSSDIHWSQLTGVWNDLVVERGIHPWKKPLSLMERLVHLYTNLGDVVLDPFAGSGTTLQACKNLGRRYVGVDISIENTLYMISMKL